MMGRARSEGLPMRWALSRVIGEGKLSFPNNCGIRLSKYPTVSLPSDFSGMFMIFIFDLLLRFSRSSVLSFRNIISFSIFSIRAQVSLKLSSLAPILFCISSTCSARVESDRSIWSENFGCRLSSYLCEKSVRH